MVEIESIYLLFINLCEYFFWYIKFLLLLFLDLLKIKREKNILKEKSIIFICEMSKKRACMSLKNNYPLIY